jgi:hypothetical protein
LRLQGADQAFLCGQVGLKSGDHAVLLAELPLKRLEIEPARLRGRWRGLRLEKRLAFLGAGGWRRRFRRGRGEFFLFVRQPLEQAFDRITVGECGGRREQQNGGGENDVAMN